MKIGTFRKDQEFVLERLEKATNIEFIGEATSFAKDPRSERQPDIKIEDFCLWKGFDEIDLFINDNYFAFDCEDYDNAEIQDYFSTIVSIIQQAIAEWDRLNPLPAQLSII